MQSVYAPQGFAGELPVLEVDFVGPPDVLSDFSLPHEFHLDDWPYAAVSFYDYSQQDETAASIGAQIYSLTPVPIPRGDFDTDGVVDAEDYEYWLDTFGPHKDLSADANGNRKSVAANYIKSRRHP